MPQPFNGARALGVAPQAYDDYFGGDDYQTPFNLQSAVDIGQPIENPSYTLSGVQSQPFAAPMALGGYDPVQEQIANQTAQTGAAKRQAEQEIFDGGTDWSSDEGRQKLQDYVARGVVSPTQARAMISTIPKVQKLNRYSQVPVEVAQGLNKLAQINPSDPDAWTNLQDAVAADNIPVDVQSHPQFQSDFKELKKEILSHRQQQIALGKHDPDEELIGKAMDSGIAPEELNNYLGEDGKLANRLGLRYAISQARNTASNTGETAKELAKLGLATIQPPTDEEKNEWLARNPKVNGPDKFTQAWNGVKSEKGQMYNEYMKFLQGHNYRKLPTGVPQGQPQAPAPEASQQTPSFNTPEEAEASGVPSGTIVLIGGRKFRKN